MAPPRPCHDGRGANSGRHFLARSRPFRPQGCPFSSDAEHRNLLFYNKLAAYTGILGDAPGLWHIACSPLGAGRVYHGWTMVAGPLEPISETPSVLITDDSDSWRAVVEEGKAAEARS